MTFPRLQNRINSEMVADKVTHVTLKTGDLTYDMNPYDHVVLVTVEDDNAIVNLPPVADAAGQFYMIYLVDKGGEAVDIKTLGDEITSESDVGLDGANGETIDVSQGIDLSSDGDYALMFSTGVSWHIVASHGVTETS